MSMMMNKPMVIVLLLILTLSACKAQSTAPSSVPTSVTTRSSSPSLLAGLTRNPATAAPAIPSPTASSPPPYSAPIFGLPTTDTCANNPEWRYEYWDYFGCTPVLRNLTCDHSIVDCLDYGNLGAANDHCCKCNPLCFFQCNDSISIPPSFDNDCYTTGGYTYSDDFYGDDDDGPDTIVLVVAAFIFVCCGLALCQKNNRNQQNSRRDATQQTMAARRRQQRANNTSSQGLTEEERNHSRYEVFLTKFYFQTVLPDKSNITANSLRSSASKPIIDEEHPSEAHHHNKDDDDASAVFNSSRPTSHSSLSQRLSSWRRPSSKDECCICLECYVVGETICASKTNECNHVFHEACINQWLKNNDKCPLCRVELLND
ncbi:unnamed protein product [Cylindrotheca closterium]|uniref:RING-type domain-containing protein n=1 Tax=Cylindrotheca closterium TaxID=2856 RepID=A0AAD2PVR0_9STRA|nr:unnamed protein product [Cylindrotheca closterium]